jgi:hypothetical protein
MLLFMLVSLLSPLAQTVTAEDGLDPAAAAQQQGNPPENPGQGNPPENPGQGNPPENPGQGNPPENPGDGDKVWVCNSAANTPVLLHVSANAANDNTLGFPFRYADADEIKQGFCDDEDDNGNGDGDKVWVCNIAANTPVLLHVSANAANDNTLGFPFRYASDAEIAAGECDVDKDETGKLIVKKYFCKDKDLKHPTVGKKDHYDHCKPAKPSSVEFYVLAFGETKVDLDESTLLSTGVTLPVGTHELFEVFKGKAYSLGEFEIKAGETTTITVFNPAKYDKPDHDKPDYDKPGHDKPGADKPGADTPGSSGGTTAGTGGTTTTMVKALPNTGSGAEAGNDAIASLTLLAGAAALAGTGMLLRKERSAA